MNESIRKYVVFFALTVGPLSLPVAQAETCARILNSTDSSLNLSQAADALSTPTAKMVLDNKQALFKLRVRDGAYNNTSPDFKKFEKDLENLLLAEKIFEFTIQLRRDNGTVEAIPAWRSRHSTIQGPGKGGIRMAPTVSRQEVINLSQLMSFKNALRNDKFGGAKGGIKIDPRKYSDRELSLVVRGYVRRMLEQDPHAIGPNTDSPAPDVGTGEELMHIMLDEYLKIQALNGRLKNKAIESGLVKLIRENRIVGVKDTPILNRALELAHSHNIPFPALASITGKATSHGGAEVRAEATGLGVHYSALLSARRFLGTPIDQGLKGVRVSLQGLGNVGSHAVRHMHNSGAEVKVITTGEDSEDGDFYFVAMTASKDHASIDIEQLHSHINQGRKLLEYEQEHIEVQQLSAESALKVFLGTKVDILVPAALENQITAETVSMIHENTIIVEAANGPTTPEAVRFIAERRDLNLRLIPGILANGGGVAASLQEYLQNINQPMSEYASLQEQRQIIWQDMVDAYENAMDYINEESVDSLADSSLFYSVIKLLRQN